MKSTFQARRISKERALWLKKSGESQKGVLLDSFNGHILVEPRGSNLGDGDVIPAEIASYELAPAWCLENKKVQEARHLLGFDEKSSAKQVPARHSRPVGP
jgi:hypothetical protein